MDEHLNEWLRLLLRWGHILAGIGWIGSSFYFVWLDYSLKTPKDNNPEVDGEAFMVHGGGYYSVEKRKFKKNMPTPLHWFQYESLLTLLTGYFLLGLIFYTGRGIYLLDSDISNISYPAALALSIGGILGSFIVYDLIWISPLRKKPWLANVLTIGLALTLSCIWIDYLSGRAAYIHVGAMLGTWMVGSVWLRILPNQQKMLDQANRGEEVDYSLGEQAKHRSVHNNYFTLPVIFIMISNHFPMTYGHEKAFKILLCICLGGVFIRHFANLKNKGKKFFLPLIPAVIMLIVSYNLTKEGDSEPYAHSEEHRHEPKIANNDKDPQEKSQFNSKNLNDDAPKNKDNEAKALAHKSKVYSIKGVIEYLKTPPERKPLKLPRSCARMHKGPALDNRLLVSDSKLKNVLVRVTSGHESLEQQPLPNTEAILDQRGCQYTPKVLAVRAGQKVSFLNSDPIFHNVKSKSKNNKNFNKAMPKQNSKFSKVFNQPEIFLQTKCSVHPWMGAYIAVVDHPYFSVSTEKGQFEITNLPTGKYTLTFWHEVLGEKQLEVELQDQDLEIKLDYAP